MSKNVVSNESKAVGLGSTLLWAVLAEEIGNRLDHRLNDLHVIADDRGGYTLIVDGVKNKVDTAVVRNVCNRIVNFWGDSFCKVKFEYAKDDKTVYIARFTNTYKYSRNM